MLFLKVVALKAASYIKTISDFKHLQQRSLGNLHIIISVLLILSR